MATKRKKTLTELMEERQKGSTNTSAYTTEPMKTSNNSVKSMVDSVYQTKNTTNTSNDTWNRVLNKANQFLNDTGNALSNLGLGIKKAGESSLYYIENMSANRNKEYQNKIWTKDRQEQLQKKIFESSSNSENKQINLSSTEDLKLQKSTTNPLLYKSELLQSYENPILRDKSKKIEEDESKIQENIENTDSAIMKKIAELTPSIGQSVTGMGASVINPGLGIAFWQTSAGGDYVRDAKARGMKDDDALLYGTIMGGMESATEWIGGELTKGVGKAFAKNGVIKGLKALGLDIGENFFEEAIMEPLQETIATMTGGKETADWSNMTKRMLQSGIDGALTSILMGGASAGIGKAVKLVNKYSNGKKVSQQEIKEALEEINSKEELDIEKILVNNFGFNSQDLYKNTTVQQNLENKMNNISSELSQNEIKGILPQKRPATMQNNGLLNNKQQTIQNEQKNSQNETSQQLQQNSKYSIKMPNSNYKFEASGNQKVDNLRQDASKYWNNSKATQNLVTNMEKIISDKDYSIRLDNTIADEKGNFVNGKITKENGETIITLNPNSNRAFEFLIGHEVGHAITTPEMKKLIIDFASKNSEFSNTIESLKQNYNVNEITDEVVSDIEGQLLGNQEFINSLSLEKPNIFKQIYYTIISIANKITGNSNEALFIRDLKNKYQKAYRETQGSNIEEGKTSYSKENDKKFGKYWQIETQKDIFKNIKDNKQLQQKAFDYIFNGNKNYEIITDKIDNKNVKFARISASEFLYGTNSKKLDKQKYGQKMRMATSIDDLIENADITYHSPLEHNNKLFKAGFNNYQGKVGIDNNIFRYIVRIGKAKNDNLFYDVSLEFLGNKNGTEITVPSAINTSPIKNSVPNNSIPSSKKNVNTTEYSMQESENNSGSFSMQELEERLSGDKLLDAQDFIEEIKNVGAEVDKNGYVTVYHQTTSENAKKIKESGKMSAKEDGIFFSTSKNAQQSEGRGTEKIKFKIPAEMLQLDDIFDDNADVRIPLKSRNEVIDISQYLVKENNLKQQQLDIILKNNLMQDDYHTGIRTINDIKTFDEVIDDDESFVWGDFSQEDAKKALEKGSITIYSSYPIENGVFVSTSKNQAIDYAGNGKIYSKEVPLNDIAWINGDEGQYAKIKENKAVDNKGRKLTKEQQEYFKDSKVRDENGNLLEVYHRTKADFNTFDLNKIGSATDEGIWGRGFYFSNKDQTHYGNNRKNVYLNIKNPFVVSDFKTIEDIANYLDIVEGNFHYEPNGLIRINYSQVRQFTSQVKEKGHDGVIVEYPNGTKEIVTFKPNQIKSIDNLNPTDNPDIRYSKENKEWQKYLEENFKSEGTRTFAKDVGLPQRPKLLEKKIESKVKTETFNKYKRNVIAGKEKEINNLIQIKNTTLNEIKNNISKKQAQLDNLRNKKSVTAQKIKAQIESLKERYNRVENEYIERIERRNKKVNRVLIEVETKKELKRTRKEIQKALLEKENISELRLDNAKNISAININRTDPIRLQEKIFGNTVGKKINEMFFDKVKHNTAEKNRFLNKERKEIENWGIKARSKESEVLQKYTEKTFVDEEGRELSYTEQDLIRDIPDEKIRNTIIEASKELRAKYDNYIDTANDILVDLGYSPIPKRNDYVRHFTELNDIFSKYGIPGKFTDSLPTDINGITEQFRPGKNYFANAERRIGNKTTYDAITGIDGYLEGISNLIYHTEDIQRLRAFDKYIRDIYGENGFENLDNLNDKEKAKRIELISENHLSEYAKWLTEYTNNLAGKKSVLDRSVEGLMGRKVYSALNAIKKQTGSNMTGFNLGSALTNFVSLTQGASKTKKTALLKGIASSLQNIVVKDDFIDKSDFLTNRFGSESLSKKAWDKISNAGQVFMTATDYFSSNIIVRSKYYEQIAKGKTEKEAMKIADDFGSRILGDRSQGATANIFNSKMLGIVTQFQLEVNNQLDTFIHDTKKDFKEIQKNEGVLKASMGAVWTLGQLAVYQHIFNEVFESINGNRPAFDVVEIIKTALGIENDDEDETITGNLQEAVGMLIEQLPFANLFSENARVPIASAVPNPIAVATGESSLKDEALKLTYLLPPTGGGQIKKSTEGIKTVLDGGSYFTNSKGEKELRFPVEDATAKDYLKAGIFGKYALPLAKDYNEKNYKRLSAKETSLYDNSTIDYRTLNKYIDYSKTEDIKKKDRINYIQSMNIKTEEKWDLYKYNIISSIERDNGTSELSDAEYIINNKMATKSEYMKLYSEAEKNEVEFPTTETIKELKNIGLSLETYMDYKTKYKKASDQKKKEYEEWQKNKLPISKEEEEKSKTLNTTDKIYIIQNSKYTDDEKEKIYANYIGKDDTIYQNLSKLTDNININQYLDYKTTEFKADDDPNSNLIGKTISDSKKKKLISYINNSNFSTVEKLYIYGRQYELEEYQKQQFLKYVDKSGIYGEEKAKLLKNMAGTKEYENGKIKW